MYLQLVELVIVIEASIEDLLVESKTRTSHGRGGAGQGTAGPGGVRRGGAGRQRGRAAQSVSARERPFISISK